MNRLQLPEVVGGINEGKAMTEKIWLAGMALSFIAIFAVMIASAVIRHGNIDFTAIEEISEVAAVIAIPEAVKEQGLKVTLFYTMKDGPVSEVYKFQNRVQASYFAEAVKRRMLK